MEILLYETRNEVAVIYNKNTITTNEVILIRNLGSEDLEFSCIFNYLQTKSFSGYNPILTAELAKIS